LKRHRLFIYHGVSQAGLKTERKLILDCISVIFNLKEKLPPETMANSTTATTSQQANIQTCDGYVSAALTRDKTVQFLIQKLVDMGCEPPEGFINCMDCEGKPVSGGFGMLQEESIQSSPTVAGTEKSSSPKKPDCTRSRQDILDQFQRDRDGKTKLSLKPEIYLCAEHVTGPKHANTILAHELIHAIDMCRAKMDPLRNCMQLACTEIRAENLSGECNMSWEFLRAKLDSYMGHGQDCVRRRAIDSVRANPNCTDKAELFVDAAMERCYADTFPFDRHPNQR
jgi:inner membrane protease ATP23